jgi:Family of unknown function (DUF6174)
MLPQPPNESTGQAQGERGGTESASSEGKDKGWWRPILIGLAGIGLTVVAAVVALELFVADRLPQLTKERLEAAIVLWKRAGPHSYDLDLKKGGVRPGPIHVEVRQGRVTKVTIDGREPSPWTWDTWTVAGQFETIERELELAEDPVHQMATEAGTTIRLRCEFDEDYGYPREYRRLVSGAAPAVSWSVTRFTVR